jgi:hypothetical protein
VTNRRAGVANKQERTHRDLRLCFYVLQCVNDETVYDKKTLASGDTPQVKNFPPIDWEAVAMALSTKRAIFHKKHKDTQRLSESFTEMKLAPPLYAFDHLRFAMDEYGNRSKVFDVVDVEEKQPSKEEKDQEQEPEQDETIIRPKDQKAVVVSEVQGDSMFTDEEYPLFDYSGDSADDILLSRKATPEQYIAEAQKLR